MYDNETIVIGFSGHGLVVSEAALRLGMKLRYYADRSEVSVNPYGLKYLGFEQDVEFQSLSKEMDLILGIGDNYIREKVVSKIDRTLESYLRVIDPAASVSAFSNIGMGSYVGRNVSVNPLAIVGNFCILNTGCIVEHGCSVGDFAHIAPGAVLAGDVEVGRSTFVGANAVVKQGVKIGANVIIGAGAVILNDVQEGKTIVGNPGKYIKRN